MNPDLNILHLTGNRFQVVRKDGVAVSPPVELPDPAALPIEGWPQHTLLTGLRWYLEDYVKAPGGDWRVFATKVLAALDQWGEQCFARLFEERNAQRALVKAGEPGLGWALRVEAADARVLAWPWEALRDQLADPLGVTAAIERCVPSVGDPPPLPSHLASDRIRVLLVIARRDGADVGYRAISGALVQRISTASLPVEITLLRPSTFKALQEAIHPDKEPYHILHFDGHGTQGATGSFLAFEKEGGELDPIAANRLALWLSHNPVPVVVLSACRSGAVDEGNASPFSGVATELLRGGVRSVVAMSHVLQRDGAMEFVPAFYRELMRRNSVPYAVMKGRLGMHANPSRAAFGGKTDLRDHILPVVYQNQPVTLSLSPDAPRWRRPRRLPDEATLSEPLRFRDPEILALERALRDRRQMIVVTGSEKVGKTVLAMDFATWLDQTGWPGRVDWIGLAGLSSAGALLNRMGMVHGQEFFARGTDEKIRALAKGDGGGAALLTVWDGLDATEAWSAADQAILHRLVDALPGQPHRILAAARTRPGWIASAETLSIHLDC